MNQSSTYTLEIFLTLEYHLRNRYTYQYYCFNSALVIYPFMYGIIFYKRNLRILHPILHLAILSRVHLSHSRCQCVLVRYLRVSIKQSQTTKVRNLDTSKDLSSFSCEWSSKINYDMFIQKLLNLMFSDCYKILFCSFLFMYIKPDSFCSQGFSWRNRYM